MTNLSQRVLMFFIFIPLIIALIVLLPEPGHLALQIVTSLVGLGLAFEVAQLVGLWPPQGAGHLATVFRVLGIVAAGVVPLIVVILINFEIVPGEGFLYTLSGIILWVFTSQVFLSQKRDLQGFMQNTLGYLLIIAYPVLGLAAFMRLNSFEHATILSLVFLGAVFLNDTAAYLAGRLWGKFSSHPVRISPNKTFVGFLAGFLISITVFIAAYLATPQVFTGGWPQVLVTGTLIGFAVIVGDLFESGLKRTAGLKDSGAVILGRGGLLDSLDSLLFSAPLFYIAYTIFYSL